MSALQTTPDPTKPGFSPGKTIAMFDVPVDVWSAAIDGFAAGTVHCRLVQLDRVGGRRAGETIHRIVPVSFTGMIETWINGQDGERLVSAVTRTNAPLDRRDAEDREPCDDPAIPDSINDALIEFVADAAQITADMARSRALLAAAEAMKPQIPAGVWL